MVRLQASDAPREDALRVLSLPARRNVATNAYTALMAAALEGAGVRVDDFNAMRVVLLAYDVIHIHWPHGYAHGRSALQAWFRSFLLILALEWQKARGARLVWTVHDFEDTIGARPMLQRWIMRTVDRRADGYVFLSESSRAATISARPNYASKPHCITFHGVYGDAYPRVDRRAARAALGIADNARVAGYVGDMKPYKGLMDLLECYAGPARPRPVLIVAGAASDPEFASAVRARLRELIAAGAPILWIDKRLSNEEMAEAIAACDLIVAPYRVSWNSGIATLALEHDRPLLCRDAAIFRELQDEVGEHWIKRYQAPLNVEIIAEALASPAGDIATLQGFVARRQWAPIGETIANFYRALKHA